MIVNISSWLQHASKTLKDAGVDSPARDAQLILIKVLGYDELQLISNASRNLEPDEILHADSLLRQRLEGIPVAYILGYKEFYGLKVEVDERVLIPRPESEALVEWLDKNLGNKKLKILDVGTGSGAIALAIKHTLPKADVYASDISKDALSVAKHNAKDLGLKITFFESDLLKNSPGKFDVIVANLPYLDKDQKLSKEVHSEPAVALYAKDGGMALYNKLFAQIDSYDKLPTVLIEHDSLQSAKVEQLAKKHGYARESLTDFASLFTPKE